MSNEATIVLSAKDATGAAFTSLRANLGAAKGQIDTLSTTLGGIGGVLAASIGGLSIAGFAAMVKGGIESAAAMHDLSIQTGASVESLSALADIGRLSDVSVQTIGTSMNRLAKNMAGATEESKGAGKAVEALGLNFDAFKSLSPDEQMRSVAKALEGFQDGAGKSAVAMAMFGKEGAKLLPLFKDLAVAGDLQTKITAEQAAMADSFSDNLTRVKIAGEDWRRQIVMGMLPALDTAAQAFVNVMAGAGGMRDEVKKLSADGSIQSWTSQAITSLTYLLDVGSGVIRTFESIGKGLGALAAMGASAAAGDFGQIKTIWSEYNADMQKAWTDKTFGQKMREQIASLEAVAAAAKGAGKAAEEAKPKLDFVNIFEKNGKAAKDALTDAEKLAIAGQKLAASLLAQESGLSGDFAQKWEQLGAAYQAGAISLEILTQAQAVLLAQQPAMVAAHKAEQKALEDLAKTMAEYEKASEAGVAAAMAAAVHAETELAQYGLLKSQVQQLTLAHLEQSRELAALAGEDVSNIEKRIEAQRRLIAATQGIEAKDIARESAKAAAAEWQRAADQINQSLTDALMDAFMSGKGFGKTFVDSVTSMFKTMVLRPVISAIVTNVTGSLGIGGAANAATSAGGLGSLFSSASSAGSLYNMLSTGYAGSIGTGVGSLFGGTAGNAAIGTYLTGSASSAAAAAQAAAVAGGAAETAASAAAGIGSSLGTLAAAAPYIASFVAAVALIDKYAMASSTPHTGGGSQYSAAGGLQTTMNRTGEWVPEQAAQGYWSLDPNGSQWIETVAAVAGYFKTEADSFAGGFTSVTGTRTEQTVELTSALVKGIVGILDSTAVKFGQAAGYTAATSFADDSSKDGAWGSLRIADAVGNVLTDWQASQSFRTFADGAAGSAQYQAAIATDVRAALNQIDLPAWARDMLAAIGETPDLTSLGVAVAQIGAVADALKIMGDKMAGFAVMSDATVSALIKAAGGFEALAASAATYYENFYSESEKAAYVLGDVGTQLAAFNLAVPTTREAFRALVEQQQALGNADALAVLLKVSGAFASVVPVTETLTGAVEDLGAAARDAAREMERAVNSVNDEIKRLRGELVAGSPSGQAYLLAQFATLTGQARAGSVTAMEQLPEISQAIESAAALTAVSALDIARTRAWLANSLGTTAGAPAGAVFSTMPASTGSAAAAQAASTAQLEVLVQKLTTEVEGLRMEARATATHTSNINRQIERLTPDGDALSVREAAAL